MSYKSMFQDVRDAVDWVHLKVKQPPSLTSSSKSIKVFFTEYGYMHTVIPLL